MENSVLEIKNVSKYFGRKKVLDNINLDVKPRRNLWIFRTKWSRKNNNYKNDIRSFINRWRRNKD
jgi:ABC-type branched-subunit amino acid transport system ATPase component